VFGVGIAKRLNEVRWTTAQRMAAAWVITLPAAATVAGLTFLLINLLPHAPAAAVAIVAH
jgi:PiT family inorganic phosphate transporter